MAHALRELCADIASGLYLEDESTHQTTHIIDKLDTAKNYIMLMFIRLIFIDFPEDQISVETFLF